MISRLVALVGLAAVLVVVTGCTKQETAKVESGLQTAEQDLSIALKDTNAACEAAEPIAVALDAGAPVTFICTAAEAAEEAGVAVTQAVVKVAPNVAAAFAAKHAKHRMADAGAGG